MRNKKLYDEERRKNAIPMLVSGIIVLTISLLFSSYFGLPIERVELLSVAIWTIGMATVHQCRDGFNYDYASIGFVVGAIALMIGSIGIEICFPTFISNFFALCIYVYSIWQIAITFMHRPEPYDKEISILYWVIGFTMMVFT